LTQRPQPAGSGGASAAPSLRVRDLLAAVGAELSLRLVAGRRGLDRVVLIPRVQRPGLALTGFTEYIRYGRVQILGGTEVTYLRTLPPSRRRAVLRRLARCEVTCFVVTKGLVPPPELLAETEQRGVPVLVTRLESTRFIKQLSAFLDDRLALRMQLHSVLLDVFGLGVLIIGESGIGKSECGLDLIDRGHRLVADDVVEIKRLAETLVGSSPDLTRYHMELRGLGVINIKDLYGVSSIRLTKRVELVVSLERWEEGREYDRLGLGDERYPILGVEAPLVRMPVAPGRNLALLVEVAARNQLLKARGYDAARLFADQVDEMLAVNAGQQPPRARRAARAARATSRRPRR
jgi:HPr kinase/phosphorylase